MWAGTLAVLLLVTFSPTAYYMASKDGKHLEALRKLGRSIITPWLDHRWNVVERKKQRMQKYRVPEHLRANASALPVYAITLARLPERQANLAACMAPHNISYQTVWGVDGRARDGIPDAWLRQYAGPRYRAWVSGGDQHKALMLANKLSHVAAWHTMLARRDPLAVVLEDDACVGVHARWAERVVASLEGLPADWDLLYLWAFGGQRGALAGDGLRVVRKIAGTACYVLRDSGAIKLLELFKGSDNSVDKTLFYLESDHKVQAYIVEPELCGVSGKLKSTLEYPGKRNGKQH